MRVLGSGAQVAVANTFSAAQTVQPSSDAVPLTLKQATGGSADLFKIQTSTAGLNMLRLLDIGAATGGHSFGMVMAGDNGGWSTGVDTAATTKYRDWFLGKLDYPSAGNVNDVLYLSHNGATTDPTFGVGIAQPDATYRMQVGGPTVQSDKTMGTLLIKQALNQTGDVLSMQTNGGTPKWYVTPDASGNTWTMTSKADATGSTAVLQILAQADSASKLALLANGNIQAAGTLQLAGDSNAVLSRVASGLMKVASSLKVTTFLAVGAGTPDTTPNATLNVVSGSGSDCSAVVKTASGNGNFKINALDGSAVVTLYTQNASALRLGANNTTKIEVSSGGNLGFYGATPVAQAARPTTLAEVITALANLGLTA